MIDDTDYLYYSGYLRKRSFLGSFYRFKILYPRISKLFHGSLLDVGCGIGDMLAFRPGSVGVDVNLFNVRYCVNRGLNAINMPIDSIPLPDQSFDSVILDNVLEHLADPNHLILEIRRVLRPNGFLVVGVPGLKGQAADPDHKVYYNEEIIDALAGKLGFKVNMYTYAPLFRSKLLSRTLKQYCIYSQWQKLG